MVFWKFKSFSCSAFVLEPHLLLKVHISICKWPVTKNTFVENIIAEHFITLNNFMWPWIHIPSRIMIIRICTYRIELARLCMLACDTRQKTKKNYIYATLNLMWNPISRWNHKMAFINKFYDLYCHNKTVVTKVIVRVITHYVAKHITQTWLPLLCSMRALFQ